MGNVDKQAEEDLWNEIIEAVRGTCRSLDEVLESWYERADLINNSAFLAELDNQIFCCNACGWWCTIDEMSESPEADWDCRDCYPEDED